MKVLVTGASGFIGSWLVKALIEKGHDVKILRRKSSDLGQLKGLNYSEAFGDVTDLESLQKSFEGIDVVYHLAGVVGYSKAQRVSMNKVNIGGTEKVIAAALAKKIKRLVYASSVVTIGAGYDDKKILDESHVYNIQHLNLGYFETKRIAEEKVVASVREQGLNAVILNPSTVYGAGDALKGSRKMQVKIANGKFPFYTSGGVSVASVEDVVQGFVSASEKGRIGERYILAGENVSIKNLFALIAEAAQQKPPAHYLPNPVVRAIGMTGDFLESIGKKGPINSENAWSSLLFHWYDSSKAKKELGYNVTPAKKSIAASVNWMKENGLISQ